MTPIHSCFNNISDRFNKINLAAGLKKNLQYVFKLAMSSLLILTPQKLIYFYTPREPFLTSISRADAHPRKLIIPSRTNDFR